MAANHLSAVAAALQAMDAETLVGSYVDGFVFEDVAAREIITTREDLHGYFEGLFSMLDVAFGEVVFFECGDRGAGTWVWSGTNQLGEAFSVRGASIFEMAEGGIRREAIFYDPRPAFG